MHASATQDEVDRAIGRFDTDDDTEENRMQTSGGHDESELVNRPAVQRLELPDGWRDTDLSDSNVEIEGLEDSDDETAMEGVDLE